MRAAWGQTLLGSQTREPSVHNLRSWHCCPQLAPKVPPDPCGVPIVPVPLGPGGAQLDHKEIEEIESGSEVVCQENGPTELIYFRLRLVSSPPPPTPLEIWAQVAPENLSTICFLLTPFPMCMS